LTYFGLTGAITVLAEIDWVVASELDLAGILKTTEVGVLLKVIILSVLIRPGDLDFFFLI
jgi:uncharacterized membrane protein